MRRFLKWAGYTVGGLLVLLLIVGAAMYVIGGRKVDRTYALAPHDLDIPSDSAALARGAYLASTNGCNDCHTPNFGGQVMVDAPPFRVVASNLTRGRGGIGERYTPADYERVIRHGVKPDGRPVFIMPSAAFNRLSDEDTAALIAYLQRLPAVDNELPATEIRVPGRIMAAAVLDPAFEVRLERGREAHPPVGPTPEYGEYIASVICVYCHGEDLAGLEEPPGPPGMLPAPSLAAAARWTTDEFKRTLRTGTTPGGRELNQEFMPIVLTSRYSDTDLEALHAYLGQRFGTGAAPAAQAR